MKADSGGLSRLEALMGRLSPEPTRRGREFEQIAKWFLENDPVYRSRLKRVWLWREWPGRWGQDAGIDLVAEALDGSVWAVQAKAYSPHVSITKKDVDTFLAESSRTAFSYRLLIASTDRIGVTARRTLEGQGIPVGTLMLSDLGRSQVAWPTSLAHLRPISVTPKKLRPHQRRACRDVLSGLAKAQRGQLVMACGTGKTLTALSVAEGMGARRVLTLTPSLSLLAQGLSEWVSNATEAIEFIAVCSDDSVVEGDMAVSSVSDLPFPVTTDPSNIAKFLRARSSRRKVVFATYQSSPRIAQAMDDVAVPALDLVIADEAHRLAGPIDSDFGTVLLQEAIRAKKRLFMTATPKYFTGRVLEKTADQDFEVASMDDETLFGPKLHVLSFAEAIERGLLSDYQVAIVGIEQGSYFDWAKQRQLVEAAGIPAVDAQTLATHVGLAKALKKFDLRRTISFHSRIASAKRFAGLFPRVVEWMPEKERPSGLVTSDYISGAMSAGERSLKIAALSQLDPGERRLLSNARCLTEGVDVPALDGVAFIDPRRSEVDIVQAVGRAIRLAPDKKVGTIVVPVFLEDAGSLDAEVTESAFRPVWDVVKALRAHDRELAIQLDGLRQRLGQLPNASVKLPPKVHLDLPEWVSPDFSRAVTVRIIEHTTANWDFVFGVLRAYVKREGTARVPSLHVEDGVKLGAWVSRQRSVGASLSVERRTQLQSLPGWSWDPYTDDWEERIAMLRRYAERTGAAAPPLTFVEDGVNLGTWVGNLRRLRESIPDERQRQLEELPGWTWTFRSDAWERGFEFLMAYVAREGSARVPFAFREDGFDLGGWVARQRSVRGKLTADQRRRLEEMPGWAWAPQDEDWTRAIDELRKFAAREGHAAVPIDYVAESGFKLGSWVSSQRSKRHSMPVDRRRALESVPNWSWAPIDQQWERAFTFLSEYVAREGTALVPARHVEQGFRLGSWINRLRTRREGLSLERQQQLEGLQGWSWDPMGDAWERAFSLLESYVAREGVARVAADHLEDGFRLGQWVAVQRQAKKTMSSSRRERLENLPGWAWDGRAGKWWEFFDLLRQYATEFGHARVPYAYVTGDMKLGQWVAVQRHRRTQLDEERRRLLEGLPGWSWTPKGEAWDTAFAHLQDYVSREGTARVPSSHVEAGHRLGTWVVTQRVHRTALSAERQRLLEQLPGWSWDVAADNWDRGFAALERYVSVHGTALVPAAQVVEGFRLGGWVRTQRRNRASLSKPRRQRLESLPGWSWSGKRK